MNIIEKLKGWFMTRFRFDTDKLEKAFNVYIATGSNMRELISDWLEIYQGNPNWVGSGNSQILGSLNVGSTIINDLAMKAVSEIAMQDTADELLLDFWNEEIRTEIRRQLEYALAGGAVAIRPYYDNSFNRIALSWYTADSFIPVDWIGHKCMSGIFVDREEVTEHNQTVYYTKFECHKWTYKKDGKNGDVLITVKCYKSFNPDVIEQEVSLSSVPKWATIQSEVEAHNIKEPLFVYMNTPFANNKNLNSKIGVSLYKDGVKLLEDIDRTYDNLEWEIESTQHKLFVDEQMLESERKTNGEIVPKLTAKDKRLFKVMSANGAVNRYMDEYSPAIRQADIVATLKTQLSLLCSNIHLDSSAYIYDQQTGAVTAREITSKQQKTYMTITDIQMWMITPALERLYNCVKQMQMLYKLPVFREESLAISYGDSILTDEETSKENAMKETQYGLRSKKSYLMEYRGLSEEEAKAEIEAIKAETPEKIDFFGDND